MKKTIYVALSILFSTCLTAQTKDYYKNKKHEIRLSMGSVNDDYYQYDGYYTGYHSYNNILTPYEYEFSGYLTGPKKTAGVIGLSYFYHAPWLNGRFSLGTSLSFSNFTRKYNNRLTNSKIGDSKEYNIALSPSVRYAWIAKPLFQFYSGIGVSVYYNNYKQKITNKTVSIDHNEKETKVDFMITPIGFSIGHYIFAFGEINAGGRAGEIVGGIGYRF